MGFIPYLHFDGTCTEAMSFYANVFGATDLQTMRYRDAPLGPETIQSDRIIHAQFTLGDAVLMASDFPPGIGEVQQAVSIMHTAPTLATATVLFDKLLDGGTVIAPFGPSFFAPGFGILKDQFGTHWIISVQPEKTIIATARKPAGARPQPTRSGWPITMGRDDAT